MAIKAWGYLVAIIGLSVCLCSGSALAQGVFDHPVRAGSPKAEALQSIAAKLRQQLPIEGAIRQQKHLSILRQPMVSQGTFTLANNGQLHWRIREPFAVAYHMEAGQLTRTMDGETETLSASAEPALYGFFQLFGRLFELSLSDLQEYFSVSLLTASETREHWIIGLTPADSRLQKMLAHIVVQGQGGVIEQVTLTEPGDDYTVLHFTYTPADT
jgi:quercetin dioxygenase-like cupin family protein